MDTAEYLAECRRLSVEAIRGFIPEDPRLRPILYAPMLDYPFREAKGLRPGLCIAACCAFGGRRQDAARSAAVIELYHNAFLIHDDVEDGSEKRRDAPTLHRLHGVSGAINIGDAMLALALQPLLDNLQDLGLGPALRILQVVARMSRESAEGQAIELDWIHRDVWDIADRDYVRMVHKKTGWYSFVAPLLIGSIVAGVPRSRAQRLSRFAAFLGIGFQIQDDLLNVTGREERTGKEARGDLGEGKRTLMLLHLMRNAGARDQERLRAIFGRRSRVAEAPLDRISATEGMRARLEGIIASLIADSRLAPDVAAEIVRGISEQPVGPDVSADGADFVVDLMKRHGSIEHASSVARRYASRARRDLERIELQPSIHRDLLFSLADYVIERDH